MKVIAVCSARVTHGGYYLALIHQLPFANMYFSNVGVECYQAVFMADLDGPPVIVDDAAENHPAREYCFHGRASRCRYVDACVVVSGATVSEKAGDCPRCREHGIRRDGCFHNGNFESLGCAGDEYPLPRFNLARIADSIDSGDVIEGHTIRERYAVKILARLDNVIDASGAVA